MCVGMIILNICNLQKSEVQMQILALHHGIISRLCDLRLVVHCSGFFSLEPKIIHASFHHFHFK